MLFKATRIHISASHIPGLIAVSVDTEVNQMVYMNYSWVALIIMA